MEEGLSDPATPDREAGGGGEEIDDQGIVEQPHPLGHEHLSGAHSGGAKCGPADALVRGHRHVQTTIRLVEESETVGLCATCRNVKRITSDRGSRFYLCELSKTDSRFPKYPRLPVLRCKGYAPIPDTEEANR